MVPNFADLEYVLTTRSKARSDPSGVARSCKVQVVSRGAPRSVAHNAAHQEELGVLGRERFGPAAH
jgi:hypothetical protein